MNIKPHHLSLFIFLLILKTSLLFPQNKKHWLKREFPYLVAENSLWIGTPKGLYQYHVDEDSWSIYGEHNGLPANEVQILLWDEEFIWAATPKGLACGDIKLNKWLIYSTANGLPSNTILSIAFQDDYVWVGTNKGAARFDKLIQEWEIFTTDQGLPDSTVYDVAIDGDLVYFATANGLTEYDTNFEKWRYYGTKEGIASDTIKFIYQTTDYLWLFTNQGISRFSKKLHSTLSFTDDPRLKYNKIQYLIVDNEQFWLATQNGVLRYDPGNNLWRDFQEEINLPSRSVNALTLSQHKYWFVTKQGVAVFDDNNKNWKRYDKTHGLSAENYDAVTTYAGQVFLVNRTTIDYFKPTENRWYVYPLKDVSALRRDKTPFISLDKEKGSFVQLTPEVKFGVSGSRFTFRHQKSYQYQFDTKQSENFSESISRGDLKAQLSLTKDRTINGFYNNTDFSQVLYGVRYKGKKGDLIQEINWGDIRYEQGKNNLVPSIGIFGSSARVEAGTKTQRYKRSLVSAKGCSGEKTTGFKNDFFTGNFESSGTTLLDVDYLKNIYFRLDTTKTVFQIDKSSEKIYVDDGDPTNNTKNTLINFSIAGVVGDFDVLHPFLEYRMNYERSEIQFLEPIGDNAAVVVKAVSQGTPFERVIKKPDVISNALVNRYFVGGLEIFPYSFKLEIFDTLGLQHPLSKFGLDVNNDGKVDPEWIDYNQGILFFPDLKPFPFSVYDSNNQVSHYRLKLQFQSEITIFNLSHNHLIRGSEVVIVDGEILTRGEDYVLDYTSGTFLILKEGVVAEDSEIEVNYEYYRDSREKFHLANLGFAPSDNVQMEVNYFGFDEEQADLSLSQTNGFDFFSEFKWRFKNIDFKLTPEFARNQGVSQQGNSMHLRTDISSQKVRLFSVFEKYDQGFTPLFPKKFKLGNIHDRLAIGGTYYPLKFLDVSANWSKVRTPPQENGKKNIEENLNGKILFSKNFYPAISLSARQRTLNTKDYHSKKETIKGDLDYQVPRTVLNKLSLKSLRLYAVWRRSWEDINWSQEHTAFTDSKKIYDNQYLRIDFSPMNLVQINGYYRGKSVTVRNDVGKGSHLINRRQKLFFDVTIDRLKGVNMNVRYQGEIADYFSSSTTEVRNISINRSLQSNMRFFPGKWIRALTSFTFEFNYQPTGRGNLINLSRELNSSEKFWSSSITYKLGFSEKNNMYQLRGEWRPSAAILFYTDFNFYEITSQNSGSQLQTYVQQMNQKLEYRPTMHSLITLQYFRSQNEKLNYAATVRDNPMVWFENRWNEKLQTKLNLTYWREENRIGNIEEYSSNFSPLIGLTYRFYRKNSSVSRAEIRNDLSFSFYRQNKSNQQFNNNSFSNSLAIDYYPTSVLILRFRVVTTYKNQFYSNQDNLYNLLEVRLTAQF